MASNPPVMAGWNLSLRFGLELAALAGLGYGAWRIAPGPTRWAAVVVVPLVAIAAWGVFNVAGDPSRSGAAPIEVSGGTRLAIEVAVLGLGAVGIWVAGRPVAALPLVVLVAVHYLASAERVGWLVAQ